MIVEYFGMGSMTTSQEAGVLAVACVVVILLGSCIIVAVLYFIRHRHQESRKRVEECLEQAKALLKSAAAADVAAAVRLLDVALVRTPPWWEPPLVELKARALMRLHRYEAVVELLHDYLPERNGRLKGAYEEHIWGTYEARQEEAFWKIVLLGQACYHLGRLEEALALLQRAKWHSRMAAQKGGPSSHRMGKEDGFGGTDSSGVPIEAVNRLIVVIKFLVRRRAAGEAAFSAGLFFEAVRQFSRVLDSRKGTPQALAATLYLRRAAAYEKLARIPEAIADCSRAAALEPRCGEAVWCRAMLYETVGCYSESARDLRQLLEFQDSLRLTARPGGRGPLGAFRPLWRKLQRWWRLLRQCVVRLRGEGTPCEAGTGPRGILGLRWPVWSYWGGGRLGRMGSLQMAVKGRTWSLVFRSQGSLGMYPSSQPMPTRAVEIESRLGKVQALQTAVDHEKILGLGLAGSSADLKSVAAIETAYRVALLKHDPNKAAQFLDRCAFDDSRHAEAARAEILVEGLRLQRLVEAAHAGAVSASGGTPPEGPGPPLQDRMAVGTTERPGAGEGGDRFYEDSDRRRGGDSSEDEGGGSRSAAEGADGQLDQGGRSEDEGFSAGGEAEAEGGKVRRDLFGALGADGGREGEPKERQWRWRQKEGPRPEGEKRTLRSRLTGRRRWREEAAPLSGEYDSLLRGVAGSKPVGGGLLDEPDLGVLGSLDNLPLERVVREKAKERDPARMLVRGLKGVLYSGGEQKGQEKEKRARKKDGGKHHRERQKGENEMEKDGKSKAVKEKGGEESKRGGLGRWGTGREARSRGGKGSGQVDEVTESGGDRRSDGEAGEGDDRKATSDMESGQREPPQQAMTSPEDSMGSDLEQPMREKQRQRGKTKAKERLRIKQEQGVREKQEQPGKEQQDPAPKAKSEHSARQRQELPGMGKQEPAAMGKHEQLRSRPADALEEGWEEGSKRHEEEEKEKERVKSWKGVRSRVGAIASMGRSPRRASLPGSSTEPKGASRLTLSLRELSQRSLSPHAFSPRGQLSPGLLSSTDPSPREAQGSEDPPNGCLSRSATERFSSPHPSRPATHRARSLSAAPETLTGAESCPARIPRSVSDSRMTASLAALEHAAPSLATSAPTSPTGVTGGGSAPLLPLEDLEETEVVVRRPRFKLRHGRSRSLEGVRIKQSLPEVKSEVQSGAKSASKGVFLGFGSSRSGSNSQADP